MGRGGGLTGGLSDRRLSNDGSGSPPGSRRRVKTILLPYVNDQWSFVRFSLFSRRFSGFALAFASARVSPAADFFLVRFGRIFPGGFR